MKPPAFDYHAPSSIDEALALLHRHGAEAKPLAGGQSLTPMLNFRLARPAHLIDLNRIPALAYVRVENRELRIGAMTRHRVLEQSAIVREGWPLIPEAMQHVAHVQIRNRGTIGGSLSHADPAAEMPAVMLALDAQFELRSQAGSRVVAAKDFFVAALTTALQPDELLVEIRVPAVPSRTGHAFHELARRRGDYALVGVAAVLSLEGATKIGRARVAFTGVGERPVRAARAEEALAGRDTGATTIARAARLAAEDLSAQTDLHASSDYRREVAEVMARRVLAKAVERAEGMA